MQVGTLYCICCIKIINFENFKVLLFFGFFFIFAAVYKHIENFKLLLFDDDDNDANIV